MELDEEHVGRCGGGDEECVGGGGGEGVEGGGYGADGEDLHRAHGAWEAGARSAPRPYCTRGPTPFKETKEKMIRKKTGTKARSRNKIIQISFVFAFCGSAGTPSLAND